MPESSRRHPIIIGIDGRSGAGKTTLAIELATRLREHHSVRLFHLEDIYPGWNGLSEGMRRYLTTVLEPFRRGEAAQWHAWNWADNHEGRMRSSEPAEFVIAEGVGACFAAARPLLDVGIWIEAPEPDRRRQALVRDGDTYVPFWDQWAAQETAWLADDDVAAAADVVIAGHSGVDGAEKLLAALTRLPVLEGFLGSDRSGQPELGLLVERVECYPDPEELFELLYADSANAVWLDSSDTAAGRTEPAGVIQSGSDTDPAGRSDAVVPPSRSRFSMMADDGGSLGQLVTHGNGLTRIEEKFTTLQLHTPFFRWLESAWGHPSVISPADYPAPFTLGWMGFLGYELKRETGGSDATAPSPDGAGTAGPAAPAMGGPGTTVPEAALIYAARGIVIDHAQRCLYLLALATPTVSPEAEQWLAGTRTAIGALAAGSPAAGFTAAGSTAAPGPVNHPWPGPGPARAREPGPEFTLRDSVADYRRKIAAAQAEIAEGNSYEICLTTELKACLQQPLDAFDVYRRLRGRNPSPFAAYLSFGALQLAGTSPERFLRLSADGALRAEPIKGTRRRDPDPRTDASLRLELETSAKDRAENIMIVDLLRNDLSRYAVPNTLAVSRLCAIESYATVHQMVSTIDAQLRPDAPRAEAVAAAFPSGSMTGAPKISTMAILDKLEGAPRGAYAGAIGYFSLNGAADLSVTIRTLLLHTITGDDGVRSQRLSLGIGGAVTADSDPESEVEEIRAKAFGILSALGSIFP